MRPSPLTSMRMASLEEATDFQLPFGMGSVDASNPVMLVVTAISLIGGFALFSMASNIGSNVGERLMNGITAVIGFDPSGDSDDGLGVL